MDESIWTIISKIFPIENLKDGSGELAERWKWKRTLTSQRG